MKPQVDVTAPSRDELLQSEEEALAGLLDAGSDDSRPTARIEIARNGKVYFSFRCWALKEDEIRQCRNRTTEYEANPRMGGIKMPTNHDEVRYRAWLIYMATTPEDRARLWDNKKAQLARDVMNGGDLVHQTLLAGETERVLEIIDRISGFHVQDGSAVVPKMEAAKN